MTVRDIRYYGDPVLRTPADPITKIDDNVRNLVRDLLDSTALEGRAGVAAPQIGVGLQAFSWHIDGKTGYVLNPVLEEVRGEPTEIDEGCLSVPGLWFKTKRYPFARVRGIDLDGNEVVLEGEGLMAQMLQHETDHLKGKVYIDTLAKDERRAAMRQIRESDWF
ncbi:peptide deformylase [Gulosibacter molinativorax]|uniref:Peptide deformylase n=1 Tax=Gulosibacter molinativorax TaxID=256821 RepID=A0ABT7C6T4_9MICO|nr:peptide deformylase [Gulosibacter molinativorax]MDJ1370381.1 peptide deformylase [Gulosibacter molinativorax]QUY61294.1 Peptide deformylase [Gulosibacter molinativorax]